MRGEATLGGEGTAQEINDSDDAREQGRAARFYIDFERFDDHLASARHLLLGLGARWNLLARQGELRATFDRFKFVPNETQRVIVIGELEGMSEATRRVEFNHFSDHSVARPLGVRMRMGAPTSSFVVFITEQKKKGRTTSVWVSVSQTFSMGAKMTTRCTCFKAEG